MNPNSTRKIRGPARASGLRFQDFRSGIKLGDKCLAQGSQPTGQGDGFGVIFLRSIFRDPGEIK